MMKLRQEMIRLSPQNRLYQLDRPIIALTGGIATGKSTVSKILRSKGYSIIDADQLVKTIYEKDETKNFIKENVPSSWENNQINFSLLRHAFFQDKDLKNKIEKFIYSHLPQTFLESAKRIQNQNFYIYDVPLLYEKHLEEKVDASILVYTNRETQLQRLMARDGSPQDLANKILDQQLDIEVKKRKADFVISNLGSTEDLKKEVDTILNKILEF